MEICLRSSKPQVTGSSPVWRGHSTRQASQLRLACLVFLEVYEGTACYLLLKKELRQDTAHRADNRLAVGLFRRAGAQTHSVVA